MYTLHKLAFAVLVMMTCVMNAKAAIVWNACIVRGGHDIPVLTPGIRLQNWDSKHCDEILPDLTAQRLPGVGIKDSIVIWPIDDSAANPEIRTLSAAKLIAITIQRQDLIPFNAPLPQINREASTYIAITMSSVIAATPRGGTVQPNASTAEPFEHGDKIVMTIKSNVPDNVVISQVGLSYQKRFSPYGVARTTYALWVPIGLFSTTFQSTADGIPFASLPVGLAAGFKIYLAPDRYLGLSAMGNWLIAPGKTSDGKPEDSINLSALTVGSVVDFFNFAYIGYAYGLDLRADKKHPGSMFVIGAGPGLIQFLQSKL